MDRHGHTPLDAHVLQPLGLLDATQPRERPVPCASCGTATFNQAGRCDTHWVTPAAVRLANA